MSELSQFQKKYGEWADKTFNQNNQDSRTFCVGRINHFMKEAEELLHSSFHGLPEEAADCFLLLLHIGHIMGFDLLTEARRKKEKNQEREWGKPGKDGVIEHIKDKCEHTFSFRLKTNDWECKKCGEIMADHGDMLMP
jgi:ribosomal protein S27AE